MNRCQISPKMTDEIGFENGDFHNFRDLDLESGEKNTSLGITHRPLPTYQILSRSDVKSFVPGGVFDHLPGYVAAKRDGNSKICAIAVKKRYKIIFFTIIINKQLPNIL